MTSTAEPAVAQAVDEGDSFVPLAPVRVLDTRNGTGGQTGPVEHGLFLDLSTRVPASATAVVLNLTGTQPSATTYLRVVPSNMNVPEVSSLHLVPGETRANQVTVALSTDERQIYLGNNAGTVHLIADLAGYYTTDTASRFTSMSPTRVLDTRATRPVGPASTVEVDLSTRVPATATAVTFNLTGTVPTTGTYVTAYPSGTTRPTASSLNLAAGQTTPNLVTVRLGANRRVTLYNLSGNVHLIVDVAGYYATDRGHRFFPVSPIRAVDTRAAGGALGPATSRSFDLASRIPATAVAAVVNLVGTSPTSDTYVTAYPTGTTRPLASNLNLAPQRDTSNSAVVALGTGARMTLYNYAGSTNLLADLAGFFATPPPCTHDCVYAWGGALEYGQTPTRRPWLSGVTSVSASYQTAYALKSDGTVWSWGDNQFGQLGAGAVGGTSTVPLQVSGLTGVTAIAAGTWAGYALKSDGTVWAWGWGRDNQLGTGNQQDSTVPVRVWNLTGVTAIAATHQGAYALRSDGTVWAWGSDAWDGLGNATCPTGQTCPPGTAMRVSVPLPGTTRVTAIAAGASETAFALRSDGTMWAWGRNWTGETGTGAPPHSSVFTPRQVVGLTDVVTIAGGNENGYAVTADGRAWAWGENYWGTMGVGDSCADPATLCDSNVPVQISGLTGPTQIDSRAETALAVRPDGTVWAWGRNSAAGDLGNGTSGDCSVYPLPASCRQSTPTQTTIAGVSDIASGGLGQFAVVPG